MTAQDLFAEIRVARLASLEGFSSETKSFKDGMSQKKGRLIVSLILESPESVVNLESVFSLLKRTYFSSNNTTVLESLKEALNTTVEKFNERLSLNILVVLVKDNKIYLLSWGNFWTLLCRGKQVRKIFSAKKDKIWSCSGILSSGDNFIFGFESEENIDFFREVLLKNEKVEEIYSSLKNSLNQKGSVFLLTVDHIKEVLNQDIQTEDTTKENSSPFKRCLYWFADKLPEKNFLENKVGIRPARKTAVSVGIILLVIFVISIYMGLEQKKKRNIQASYEQQFSQAQELYNDSLLQKDVNSEQARDSFLQAKSKIDEILVRGIKDVKVDELKLKIDDAAVLILGEVRITPTVYLDLSLVREEVLGGELGLNKNTLSVLDKKGNKIIQIDIGQKGTSVLGGTEKLSKAQTFVPSGGRYYVLAEQGVVSLTKSGESTTVIQKDDEWGEITKLSFYSGSLYLLDKKGSIWRYPQTGLGFGAKQSWLKDEIDLSFMQDLAVDGYLWALTDRDIFKLARGVKDTFKISGLEQKFFSPQAFYTDEVLESIFVLDQNNKRIVEIDKKGVYKKQYESEVLSEVVDLAVSKENSKIFLLTQTKVLEFPLK